MQPDRPARRYLGVVPARGGSKRLPGKNLVALGDKPLLAYTLEAACAARRLDHVVVSTDSPEIADFARTHGVDPQGLRPAEIAGDASPISEALRDALTKFERNHAPVDAVVLLQPTSPFRRARHIDEAIALFELTAADTVASVRAGKEHPYWNWRKCGDTIVPYYTMEQMATDRSALPSAYVENGAIFVVARGVLESGRIYGDKVAGYVMSEPDSVDVDTAIDLQWAAFLLARAGDARK